MRGSELLNLNWAEAITILSIITVAACILYAARGMSLSPPHKQTVRELTWSPPYFAEGMFEREELVRQKYGEQEYYSDDVVRALLAKQGGDGSGTLS